MLLRGIGGALQMVGIDLSKTFSTLVETPYFVKSAIRYAILARKGPFPFDVFSVRPMLHDRHQQAGAIQNHYFFQDIWAARKIHDIKPSRHLDVGSLIEGFVAHLLCFMPVEIIDIRPLRTQVPGLTVFQVDATHLSSIPDNSIESLSSLHAIEHFGLGRYGDPIDPDAFSHAMAALARVLKPGGRLYFSVPIGQQRVQFNSQRIFSPCTVLRAFSDLRLVSFSGVDDEFRFCENVNPAAFCGARYSCGLFEFTK
jgi:SAM-dependent methyltransferase